MLNVKDIKINMQQQVIVQDNVYIPQDMFNYVIQTISNSDKNLFQFSYEELIKYSLNYDYQKANEFRMNLAKYAQRGSYYILFVEYNQKKYFQNLSNLLSTLQIQQLYNDMYSIMGITKYGVPMKDGSDKNCITVLNKSLLKLDDWIGTLQHQMTHFIQRLIGLEDTVKKNYHKKIDKTNEELNPKIVRYSQLITKYTQNNQRFTKSLIKKYTYMFAKNQIQQTLKSVLLLFKNMYERDIQFANGQIVSVNIVKTSKQDRLKWLKQFLSLINSKKYLQSDTFKQSLKLWRKKSILCNDQQLIKHRYISYILCYLGFKNILPEVDIDNKLIKYFEEF